MRILVNLSGKGSASRTGNKRKLFQKPDFVHSVLYLTRFCFILSLCIFICMLYGDYIIIKDEAELVQQDTQQAKSVLLLQKQYIY